ncbi:lysophospholipid acyltransferase family protein [Loktanella sp. SALINAS62]|uniref:lysophospholipid acyltransferase family protein n=1 Tax=Loktanella sp. SALINAS62 TaxID=2706124 RepID=UPI001B8CDEF5|nr:lysophospholipid acyltransferase family protein [Loktanella sp. SALINAS62]MBS1302781.1 1-acyl-sn-glycerol-3-phosphate acyltransferase [Loktanella sp. SALINAS62]
MTWSAEPAPPIRGLTWSDRLRVIRRAVPMVIVVFGGLALLLVVRVIEKPLFKQNRPWTPHITRIVCIMALALMGLRREQHGTPLTGAGAIVANHASWLDIFALNAGSCVTFIAKSEVADWPGIGWLARATGTLFIARNRGQARHHVDAIGQRLQHDQTLVFFPEGTSSDGRRVLPFKPTLFAPFIGSAALLQPVTVQFYPPAGTDPRTYGWWGDMDFAPHLLATLALQRQGRVVVNYHPPVQAGPGSDRKTLARTIETTVRDGFVS